MKENKKRIKIVFFGTPEFAVASLDKLVKDGRDIAAVVTMPDKVAGRGHKLIESDVKKYAVSHGLRLLQPEKLRSEEFVDELRKINADLFIVIAFRMLPEVVWNMPRLGTFNLHASLLPKYRGAAPINRALMNGDTVTGVTTFFLKHEIDTGDIIEQQQIDILPDDNAGSVHDKLMALGAKMTAHTVEDIEEGRVVAQPQPEGEFMPAPKIFKDTCHIDWKDTSEHIRNLVRGLSPYPGAWTEMIEAREPEKITDIKIFETALCANGITDSDDPGTIIEANGKMYAITGDGMIEIISLQPAGKKRMEASAFLRGYKPLKFI